MARTYYTLLEKHHDDTAWSIAFGDYDREVVAQERDDIRDGHGFEGQRLKIIATNDAQADIDAKVAEINAKLAARKA
ncbi:hypothetical protein J2R95_003200 [Bradyrhizobium japonicum]|uniref:hypothetical protein n=1 Tax=Bradyrhizobium japonicum TaxID=375 RepID=UPI0020A1FDDF|nr:hypothetical protein [Bradyrhizobium japonicum]MCP1937405.1 hypothetical protein [Bradyrhizobium japonicum]